MASKELLVLRLLIDNPGLFGSEFVHLSKALNRGTVYALLERMVEKGYVREEQQPPTTSLQLARTKHFITGEGRKAYDAFLSEQGLRMVPFAT